MNVTSNSNPPPTAPLSQSTSKSSSSGRSHSSPSWVSRFTEFVKTSCENWTFGETRPANVLGVLPRFAPRIYPVRSWFTPKLFPQTDSCWSHALTAAGSGVGSQQSLSIGGTSSHATSSSSATASSLSSNKKEAIPLAEIRTRQALTEPVPTGLEPSETQSSATLPKHKKSYSTKRLVLEYLVYAFCHPINQVIYGALVGFWFFNSIFLLIESWVLASFYLIYLLLGLFVFFLTKMEKHIVVLGLTHFSFYYLGFNALTHVLCGYMDALYHPQDTAATISQGLLWYPVLFCFLFVCINIDSLIGSFRPQYRVLFLAFVTGCLVKTIIDAIVLESQPFDFCLGLW